MPVRKRDGGVYHYRFQIKGYKPFTGSCETRDKREADRIEAAKREEALAKIKAAEGATGAPMTFGQALDRFDQEVASVRYSGSYGQTIAKALKWLRGDSMIGENTPLRDIDDAMITRAIGIRRGEPGRRGERVSAATINRTLIELLRRIWLRARDKWGVEVKPIAWELEPEPKERIRALSPEEELVLFASLPDERRGDWRAFVAYKLKSGCRFEEVVKLRQRDIDWQHGRIWLRSEVTKGEQPSSIPLSQALRAILTPLRAPTEHVFHYVAQTTSKGRTAGQRYPITYEGFKTMWRRYGPSKCGIDDFRLHDLRHTTATRLGQSGANIKVVARLLRHANIATTAKYMHVFDDDVRAAMDAENAPATETAPTAQDDNSK